MRKQEENITGMILICLAIACLIAVAFYLGTNYAKNNPDNISVPRISGVYVPIDGDNYAVVVLNMNNTYEKQLVGANQQAFSEITKLIQGG